MVKVLDLYNSRTSRRARYWLSLEHFANVSRGSARKSTTQSVSVHPTGCADNLTIVSKML